MSKNALSKTLMELAGQQNIITIKKPFVDFTGSLEGGIMLDQLLYWTPRSKMGGWIAKSDAEFSDELCLTVYGIRKARKDLEAMGIIETQLKKFSGAPTMHYKVDIEELNKKWILRFRKMEIANSQNELCENTESLTETTTKTTSKNTTKKRGTTVPASDLKPMVYVLSQVTGMDEKLNYGRLAHEALELLKADYTPQDISAAFGTGSPWYSKHWKGKKKERPNTKDIRENIAELLGKTTTRAEKAERSKYTAGQYAEAVNT